MTGGDLGCVGSAVGGVEAILLEARNREKAIHNGRVMLAPALSGREHHSKTAGVCVGLEARVGFEPTNGGFADLSLGPLGYRAGLSSIPNLNSQPTMRLNLKSRIPRSSQMSVFMMVRAACQFAESRDPWAS